MSTKNKVIFESISQVPAWINAREQLSGDRQSATIRTKESWDMGLGFDGAMDFAEKGGLWQKGVDAIMEAHVAMEDMKHTGRVDVIDNDVIGFAPDVPAFLAGQPDSMFSVEEGEVEVAPIVSIGVQLYQPAGVAAKSLFNRGAGILSVIDDLENRGVRVELWGCVYGQSRRSPSEGIDMRVLLKSADEDWSPASIAFGLCHSAFCRRLGFRVAESFENNQRGSFFPAHSIRTDNTDQPPGANFDVWFSYMDVSHSAFGTAEGALKRVTGIIEKELKPIIELRAA